MRSIPLLPIISQLAIMTRPCCACPVWKQAINTQQTNSLLISAVFIILYVIPYYQFSGVIRSIAAEAPESIPRPSSQNQVPDFRPQPNYREL